MSMKAREARVFTPENTFERGIAMAAEPTVSAESPGPPENKTGV